MPHLAASYRSMAGPPPVGRGATSKKGQSGALSWDSSKGEPQVCRWSVLMLMMWPPPCRIIMGITARPQRNTPLRLVPTRLAASAKVLSMPSLASEAAQTPALLTSTSMRP